MRRALPAIALCSALAVLELAHPPSPAGSAWLPLHVALICGYVGLTWVLWRTAPRTHAMLGAALAVFVVANTAFLALDGLAIGLGATPAPAAADALLANLTGAAWCAALLGLAATLAPQPHDRPRHILLVLTWLVFVASATPLLAVGSLLSRAMATATAAWLVYRHGTDALPSALLVFAAVLRQHVGPEAALGMVSVAVALGLLARTPQTQTR